MSQPPVLANQRFASLQGSALPAVRRSLEPRTPHPRRTARSRVAGRLVLVVLMVATLIAVPGTGAWALTSTTFAAHADLTVGSTGSAPYAVTTGDLRGIGRSDLIVLDHGLDKVSVFLSNANGTFASRVDYTLPTGANPTDVVVGDFNGDGKPDIAVADNGTSQVSVLLNSGTGTFATHVDYSVAVGAGPIALATADFNGDGKPDIAVADNGTSQVSVLLNSGTGTFPSHAEYSLPSGAGPEAIAAADVNGDGKPDIAVADNGTSQVSVLLNSGTGTFPSHVDTTLPIGAAPDGIVLADFNGDGKKDIATADAGTSQASVLLNSGTGTFPSHTEYALPTSASPSWVVAGDFNADGAQDLAFSDLGLNEVSVLAGSGTGTFTLQGPYTVGTSPYAVAAGDFNGDGRPDLATANNASLNASVLLNTTATPPTITSASSTTFNQGQAGTFTVTTTGTPAPSLTESGTLPTGVTFVDNGNGTATLSGTATTAGTYTLTITATNSAGTATQSLTLSVLAWYNTSWLYRKPVTINHTKVGGSLTNFPVLVSITDAALITKAQSSGNDILFTLADGVTKLNHQIESFTSGTGALVAWVNVTALSSTTDTVIYMYYGNSSATNQQNPGGVWDANYTAVWHLSENPTGTAPQFKDSTSNADNGTAQGSISSGAQVAGKIDGSITLNGSSNYISTANQMTVPTTDTVEVWFKTTTASGNKILGFEDTQTGTTEANYDRMLWVGTDGQLRFGVYDGSFRVAPSGTTVTDGNWHLAVGVENLASSVLYLYLDGSLVSSVATGTTPQSYTGYWRVGAYMMYSGWLDSVAGYFPGSIDEARISTVARSSAWISTEYNNENSPSTFTTLGTEQGIPSITSANNTAFTVGVAGTFTVTTTGTPTPSITESGALPTGVTFTDNGNGTATLAGTPATSATAGTYTLTITATNSAGTGTQTFTLTVNPGSLSISVPASANVGSGNPSQTISGQLGAVQVTDARYNTNATWTATVSSTTFTTGGHSPAETIPTSAVSYWSGTATSVTGTATTTPGQATSANAQALSVSRTAFTLTAGTGKTIVSWNPTVIVSVPAAAVAGTYTGTITHSVA